MARKKVLIVEDSHIIVHRMQNMLQVLGYDVLAVVNSGEAALEKVLQNPPDLILMDILLAGELDGIETARQIGAQTSVPVVYLTAYAEDALLQRAKITAPYSYLVKPVTKAALHAAIEMAFYHHELDLASRADRLRYQIVSELTSDLAYAMRIEPHGRYVVEWHTEALERITGFTYSALEARGGWRSIVHPQDRPIVERRWQALVSGQQDVSEYRIITKEKEVRWLRDYGRPEWDAAKECVVRVYGASQDITAQKQQEQECQYLLDQERVQRKLAETLIEVSNTLNSSLEREAVLTCVLKQLARVVDYDSASVMLVSQDMHEILVHRGYRPGGEPFVPLPMEELQHVQVALKNQKPVIVQDTLHDPRWYHRPSSAYIRSWLGVPIVTQGEAIGLLNLNKEQSNYYTSHDAEVALAFANQAAIAINNARLYERTRRDAETKATLLQEVNHRVKNNLSAIVGLLYAERRHAGLKDHPVYQAIMEDLANRVQCLATVHTMLAAVEWKPLPLDDLGRQVVDAVLQFIHPEKRVSVKVIPATVQVTPKQANDLALVINELATNALRYAVPDGQTMCIELQVNQEGEKIVLEFRDNGQGYPQEVLRLESYNVGFYLIRNLVEHSLRGELTLHNDGGAVAVVRFKTEVQGEDRMF